MLIAVCSVKGSPGVTTFSLALAARWPDPDADCVVVELDPAGGDIAVRFDLPTTPGLLSLAAAARRTEDGELVWHHAQQLPGGLRTVICPPGANQARAALTALGDHARTLRGAGDRDNAVIVADCGRLGPDAATAPVLHVADHTLLLTRAHAEDLAHVATQLATITHVAPRLQLLLVGPGHTAEEVSRELDVPVLATIPSDPRGAAALCGHPTPRPRRPSQSALGRAASRVADKLINLREVTQTATRAAMSETMHAADLQADAAAAAVPDGAPRQGRPS